MSARLSADLILVAPQYTNPLKNRELDLRGNKITIIENLGATLDQFHTIDLSNNDVRRLDGFPLLRRLHTLFLNNNRIARIGEGLGANLPSLEELILTNNQLAELSDLTPLFEFQNLSSLSLMQNPVAAQEHYRLFVIHHLPKLRLLDYKKVGEKERKAATELFAGPAGEAINREIAKRSKLRSAADEADASEAKKPKLDPKQLEAQAKIKEAIRNATSLEEVQRLEAELRSGSFAT